MIWREAFKALTRELRRREYSARSENNAMVKCGAVKAEVADAQAQTYRWIAEMLEGLTDRRDARWALNTIRRWAVKDKHIGLELER